MLSTIFSAEIWTENKSLKKNSFTHIVYILRRAGESIMNKIFNMLMTRSASGKVN